MSECGKAFIQSICLIRIREVTLEKKPHKCNECGKGFNQNTCLTQHMRIHILERSLINVKNVGKPLLTTHLLLNITELTLVRSSINVVSVRKPSRSMHTLVNITGFTLVRSL